MAPSMKAGAGKRVLIIGGTRFSGLYLFKELHDRVCMPQECGRHGMQSQHPCRHGLIPPRFATEYSAVCTWIRALSGVTIPFMCKFEQGYDITLFNRGKTANKALPGESKEEFEARIAATTFVKGDRTNAEVRNGHRRLYLCLVACSGGWRGRLGPGSAP
jgi:hypothetical protein